MARLRQNQRQAAVRMLLGGQTQSDVARHFGVHKSTVSRLYRRLRLTGTTNDRPRSGRPRVTTPRQDRFIRLSHLRDRFRTATETADQTPGLHNNRISDQTVRNRLRDVGLWARRPYVGLPLNDERRRVRMQWLTAHRPNVFPLGSWRQVLFSDESRYLLYRSDGRRRVYRRRNERFTDSCVSEVYRFGGGGVMVWGGICHGRKTPLVFIDGSLTAIRYRDTILSPVVVPFVQQNNLIFQQDNARAHVARACRDYLAANNIRVLEWPPYSPDLSPIEHLWDVLDRRVRRRNPPPASILELRQALQDEWQAIPIQTINNLVGSMTRRIRGAIAVNGGHTRY